MSTDPAANLSQVQVCFFHFICLTHLSSSSFTSKLLVSRNLFDDTVYFLLLSFCCPIHCSVLSFISLFQLHLIQLTIHPFRYIISLFSRMPLAYSSGHYFPDSFGDTNHIHFSGPSHHQDGDQTLKIRHPGTFLLLWYHHGQLLMYFLGLGSI